MATLQTYTAKGTKAAATKLPSDFAAPLNKNLLAQAMYVYEHLSHTGSKKTKTRSEIALTKAKWYRQKGTGNARHGAKSAPIFRGGSKAHGPKLTKKSLNLSKKMKIKALKVALGVKLENNQLVLVKGLATVKKTADANKLIQKMLKATESKKTKTTLSLAETNKDVKKVFKNVQDLKLMNFKDLNARSVIQGGLIILDADALKAKKS